MLVLGSVKSDVFFRKIRKLDILGRVCPKLAILSQNRQKCPKSKVFRIFSKSAYWISLIFCMNASLMECKKVTFLFFSGKLENWIFLAESIKNWHFSGFLGVPQNGCFHFLCIAHASDPAWRLVGPKVNLSNTYTLAIFKLFGIILIPSNPPLIL